MGVAANLLTRPEAMPRRRVLIVDDSAVARAVIARVLESDRFAVAGSVAHAGAALDFLARETVDLILLDIQMPGVDGLTALPDLLAAANGAKVLVVSSAAGEGALGTVQALALGAADTLVKPGAGEPLARFNTQLLDKLGRLSDAEAVPALPTITAVTHDPPRRLPAPGGDDFDILAIGASTGGIHALTGFLRALPASFDLPVLVTQHLPASFMPYFAAQLAVISGRPCEVATDRLRLRPGRVVVAPGDAHMRCVRLADGGGAIRLAAGRVASGCLPSVDPMLASLAGAYGERVVAVILSGMGRDGAEGARRIREAGGCVLAQDEATSVVWGMPGTVAGLGLAQAVLPPDALGRLVATRRRP